MMIKMNYKQAMEYIEELKENEKMQKTESLSELCEKLGNPQNQLPVLVVTGTNGKSSVMSYILNVLKCAGYKAGGYFSTDILEYREEIQVNGRPITKQGFCDCLELILEQTKQMKEQPSSYAVKMAAAFLYFNKMNCQLVVLEDGQENGNLCMDIISSPVAVVSTAICRENSEKPGNTLKKVAEDKAAMIRKGCHIVSIEQSPEVREVLQKKTTAMEAFLYPVEKEKIKKVKYGVEQQRFTYGTYKDLVIHQAGLYQVENGTLAVETLNVLHKNGWKLTENAVRKGLEQTKLAGRFMFVSKKPMFIADGAHNESAAVGLAESLRLYFTNKKIIYIIGIDRDRECAKILQAAYEPAEHIITVAVPGDSGQMQAYELAKEASRWHSCVTAADSLEEAVELSYLLADKESVIVAFGSFSYLKGLIRIVENREKIKNMHYKRSRI